MKQSNTHTDTHTCETVTIHIVETRGTWIKEKGDLVSCPQSIASQVSGRAGLEDPPPFLTPFPDPTAATPPSILLRLPPPSGLLLRLILTSRYFKGISVLLDNNYPASSKALPL